MPQTDVRIGEHTFRVWVTRTDEERRKGLMHVTAEQMAPTADGVERGMLFPFPGDERTGFWMKDTIIPLDIAFIRPDGTIVNIATMAPLDTRSYFPKGPYRYALEVRGNTFSRLGIRSGQKVEIPQSVLKGVQ